MAGGTRIRDGFVPKDEITVGVIGTAVKNFASARFSFEDVTGAAFFAAVDAGRFEFDVFAVGIIAAGCVFTEAAVFDCQFFEAHGAFLIQWNVLCDRRFPCRLDDPFGVAAFRISGTGHELAEAAPLQNHRFAALFALNLFRLRFL